jgi:hypothetical protein
MTNNLYLIRVKNFDPIAIRILYKSKALHSSVVGLFDKLNSQLLKTFTGLVNVGNNNPDMA